MSTATTTLAFFSSAAASFNPTPYVPGPSSAARSSTARTSSRSQDSLVTPAGMDPLPTDPDVLFIHPPFSSFPNSHLHPEGLTYNLMAENPEWFLVPADFISQHSTNPLAIPYPPHLEPPRGWCPQKKKDLKERGTDNWPEGEEPRLRCTFCRRTYAGVNAKSMWRRHVFEKHKIAMSNRRDGNSDRPRGRGSGKENKLSDGKVRDDVHDSIVSIVVAPQTMPDNVSHRSRFRTMKPGEATKKKVQGQRQTSLEDSAPSTSQASHRDVFFTADDSDAEAPARTTTPPLTPHNDSSDPPAFHDNSDRRTASPLYDPIIRPASPYNPLQTPCFRHSPPRHPPAWRFCSPSHPLHSTIKDIPWVPSLSTTPLSKDVTSSPMLYNPFKLETPANFSSRRSNRLAIELPSSPLGDRRPRGGLQRVQSSPLPRHASLASGSHRRMPSDGSDWVSEESIPTEEPFSIYNTFLRLGEASTISPVRFPSDPHERESPVLRRSGSLTASVRRLELLEPFGPPTMRSPPQPLQPGGKRAAAPVEAETGRDVKPPAKKRKVSVEGA